jgi:phosphate transport system permease protein
MDSAPLERYNRKTTLRVKLTDKAAGAGIRVGGLGVIFAVLGLILFIAWQVFPLFGSVHHGRATEPRPLAASDVLLLHVDEYRRVGVLIERSGFVTCFSSADGKVITREKPVQLGDATITCAELSLRARTTRKIGRALDVPHFHLLVGTSDGRVFAGTIAYVADYESYDLNEEPPELAALYRPEEKQFKAADYIPQVVVRDRKVIEHVPTHGLYRTVQALVQLERELDINTGGQPVRLLAGQINRAPDEAERFTTTLVVTGDGRTRLLTEKLQLNEFTEELEAESETTELTGALEAAPDFALVDELQDELILASRNGRVHHFWRANEREPFRLKYPAFSVFGGQADTAEGWAWRDLVNEQREAEGLPPIHDELQLTAVNYLLGDRSIVFGDNRGGLQSWFKVIEGGEGESRLKRIRSLPPSPAAISALSASPITKAMVVTDQAGNVRAINNTAERVYLELQQEGARLAVFGGKGDGVLALDGQGRLHHWWVDAPHSEVSWNSLFGKVWYEDYPEAKYEWQSTGGTDDVEPKLSLVPLVMGTLKGALYALIFAIPLGVLAAIYTSEFMHRNMRAILKPTMEVMASLPSVVLGFLAALYFAPLAGPIMPTLVVAVILVPAVFMVFGWVWQRCPPSFVGKFGPLRSTVLLFALLTLGIWISSIVGPRAEVYLFPASEGANPALLDPVSFQPATPEAADRLAAGDYRTWTGGGAELPRESETNGVVLPKGWWIPGGHNLLFMLVTIAATLLAGLASRKLKFPGRALESLKTRLEGANPAGMRAVAVDVGISLAFGMVLLGVGLLLAVPATSALEWAFFSYDHPTAGRVADFRRWITGPEGWKFEQANSLIVGFAMGFAVIPIIYTIAEDALTSVPNQLRAASLACGASRWQTTMRVVLPAAASGIFSGIVIGLGRALGETMIVVMAAGGTPVMDLQPLNGFRSLSAAIAIEMPEAPHGGTLYRTLFMGGLLLFLMAFVINTIAEVVRMRLRRKLSRL